MREKHREPEGPKGKSPSVESIDGLARITLKELATTHSVKSGTLQNACSTRPRVVASLGKSARMHTVRLMNNLVKGPKRMNNWVAFLQDVEQPKSTMILRKTSNILKPIRCVRFT